MDIEHVPKSHITGGNFIAECLNLTIINEVRVAPKTVHLD